MADDLFARYQREYGLTLDAEQCLACRQIEGKVLLLAVPGSGKTTVMIARLGYMTRALGINPSSILAVTYSVAGAKEMKSRYERLFGDADVEFRTINGFCAAMIHRYEQVKGRKAFTLIDKEGEVTRILKELMISLGSYPSEQELRDVRTAITFARNRMLSDDEIKEEILLESRDFLPIYQAYRDYKREHRLMDYDDQLCYGYQILKTCPEVNRVYADRFQYLCVDEAQDTSLIQHKILETMANRCGNLFMVGDEDQSIYGFRAAYPEALLRFDTTYPDAKILSIGRNYRSTASIVEAAGRFIAKNTERRVADKCMTTDNPKGEPIRHTELEDLFELPSYLAAKAGREGDRLAMLFRLNDSMLPVIDELSARGIPFRVRGNDSLFFTHPILADVRAILAFASDPFDAALFGQLYYKLSLGLRRSDYEAAIRENTGRHMLSYPDYLAEAPLLSEGKRRRMRRLSDVLFRIQGANAYEALRLIFFSSGYGEYHSRTFGDTVKRNVLLAIAYRHPSREGFFRRLEELEALTKRGSVGEGGVILSTIHSAKGMEFDAVILCDCQNGILPSVTVPSVGQRFSAQEKKLREEDRRLFYVGVTRAKRELELITWKMAFGEESEGWDFIRTFLSVHPQKKREKLLEKAERPTISEGEMASYSEGTAVHHKLFGDGVVIGRKGTTVQIRFARFPLPKKLDLRVCLEQRILYEL